MDQPNTLLNSSEEDVDFYNLSEDTGIYTDSFEDYGTSELDDTITDIYAREYEGLEQNMLNLNSKVFQEFLQNPNDLMNAISSNEDDKNFRKLSAATFPENLVKVYFTYFLVDTTLFHYCMQKLTADNERLFKLFRVWCLGIFYIGKGKDHRLFDQFSGGIRRLEAVSFLNHQ